MAQERDSRWGIAEAVVGVLLFIGGLAAALGVSTPKDRIIKVESRLDIVEPKVAAHDVILAQMKQEVDDIHDAVVGGRRK